MCRYTIKQKGNKYIFPTEDNPIGYLVVKYAGVDKSFGYKKNFKSIIIPYIFANKYMSNLNCWINLKIYSNGSSNKETWFNNRIIGPPYNHYINSFDDLDIVTINNMDPDKPASDIFISPLDQIEISSCYTIFNGLTIYMDAVACCYNEKTYLDYLKASISKYVFTDELYSYYQKSDINSRKGNIAKYEVGTKLSNYEYISNILTIINLGNFYTNVKYNIYIGFNASRSIISYHIKWNVELIGEDIMGKSRTFEISGGGGISTNGFYRNCEIDDMFNYSKKINIESSKIKVDNLSNESSASIYSIFYADKNEFNELTEKIYGKTFSDARNIKGVKEKYNGDWGSNYSSKYKIIGIIFNCN